MLAVRQWVKNLFPVKKSSEPYFILHHTDKVLYDFSSLLNGFKSHHLTPYMYLADDDLYESLVADCEAYYLFQDEAKLITQNLTALSEELEDISTVVELGPGSKTAFTSKTLKILEKCPQIKKYFALDLCENTAKTCASIAREKCPWMESSYVVENFNSISTNFRKKNEKIAFVFFGSTFGNLTKDESSEIAKSIRSLMQDGDKFFIALDTNKNLESLNAAYNSEYARKLASNILKVINKQLHTNIDLGLIDVKYSWNDKKSQVEYYFESSKDQNILLDGMNFTIKKNHKYYIVKSKKYDMYTIKNEFSQYGFDLHNIYKNSDNKMSISVLKTCLKS